MTGETGSAGVAADFRAAMRRQASTVCILSVGEGNDRRGMTATAVMSLSADPPTLAVAVNRSASFHASLAEGVSLAVNLLGEGHAAMALEFAGGLPADHRFESGAWRQAGCAPCLSSAVATLACGIERRIEHASHSLLICRVHEVHLSERYSTLVYFEGRFATIRPEAPALPPAG